MLIKFFFDGIQINMITDRETNPSGLIIGDRIRIEETRRFTITKKVYQSCQDNHLFWKKNLPYVHHL